MDMLTSRGRNERAPRGNRTEGALTTPHLGPRLHPRRHRIGELDEVGVDGEELLPHQGRQLQVAALHRDGVLRELDALRDRREQERKAGEGETIQIK